MWRRLQRQEDELRIEPVHLADGEQRRTMERNIGPPRTARALRKQPRVGGERDSSLAAQDCELDSLEWRASRHGLLQ